MSAKLPLVLGTVPSSFFQAIQWSEGNGRMWVMIQTGTQGKQTKQWMLDDVKSLFLMVKSPLSPVKSAFLWVILGFVAPGGLAPEEGGTNLS